MNALFRFFASFSKKRHDLDMEFKGKSLDYYFKCKHCGLIVETESFQEALEVQGKRCDAKNAK